MKTTINFNSFREAFQAVRPENFSYEGQEALFNYLEQFEEDTGQEEELDVIAICCDFTEAPIKEVLSDHDLDNIDELMDKTTVIPVDELGDVVIYQNY